MLPVLESCAATICPSHDYHDAPEFGHWSHAGIDYTLELGLFRGTSDTEFSPNVAMTRAMLVTVLYRMAGSPAARRSRRARTRSRMSSRTAGTPRL